jgi:hypothetical protein
MRNILLAALLLALAGCTQTPNSCPPGTTYMRAFNSCMALPGARNVEPAPARR